MVKKALERSGSNRIPGKGSVKHFDWPKECNLRASFVLVAAFILSACSSSMPATSTSPQAPGTAAALSRANPNDLTLRFKNESAYSLLFMDVDPRKSVCITSAEPADIQMFENQTEKVDIKGDNEGACKDGTREVHFLTALVQIGGGRVSTGDVHVQYDPQESVWKAKLNAGDHNVDLCTDPPGLIHGIQVGENDLLSFHFCRRKH